MMKVRVQTNKILMYDLWPLSLTTTFIVVFFLIKLCHIDFTIWAKVFYNPCIVKTNIILSKFNICPLSLTHLGGIKTIFDMI